MSKFVLVNPVITVNSVDLSDHIASISLNTTRVEVPTTAFGNTHVDRKSVV